MKKLFGILVFNDSNKIILPNFILMSSKYFINFINNLSTYKTGSLYSPFSQF